MAILAMDTVGFLQSVNRLERRFGELTSTEAMREACAHPERRDPLDHRLFVLADDVYGCGGWTTTICAAASSLMGNLITECRRFMKGTASVVRKYGMTVWLYDLVNDASKALFVGEPSDRTPLLIHPVPARELAKRCARTGKRRYGNKREQKWAMRDHYTQMYRLAAYSMLRWGEHEPRSLDIAGMMITQPWLGMCMLREDDKVLGMGALPDMRYRRVVDYIKELRAAADLDYARALAAGEVTVLDGERAPGFAEVDTRYVYDAERLIEALESLWNERCGESGVQCDGDDGCVAPGDRDEVDEGSDINGYGNLDWNDETGGSDGLCESGCNPAALAHEILMDVEQTGDKPELPLWRNPAYLQDVANSLMGPSYAGMLWMGFEEHNRELFDRGAEQLREFVGFVQDIGFLVLPVCVLSTCADDQVRCAMESAVASGKVKTADLPKYAGFGGAECGATRDAKQCDADCAGESCSDKLCDGSCGTMPCCDASGEEGDSMMSVGASMAAVAIARMPNEDLARKAALALILCEPKQYGDTVLALLEDEKPCESDDDSEVGKRAEVKTDTLVA